MDRAPPLPPERTARDPQRTHPLGDLKSELILIARYILTELDSETELLRILATETRNRPQLLESAVEQLVSSTFTGFATWIGERSNPPLPDAQATALATFALGSLLSTRLLRDLLGVPAQVDDETLVDTWVALMTSALEGSAHRQRLAELRRNAQVQTTSEFFIYEQATPGA